MTRFKNFKKIFLAFFILILVSFVLYFCLEERGSVFDEKQLFDRYPYGFVFKTAKVGYFLIGYSSENAESYFGESGCIAFPSRPPIVYLLNGAFKGQSYEIDMGNFCIWNERFVVFDVDGDGKEKVISEWVSYAGGSGGSKGLVIWQLDKEKGLMPLAGYPEEMTKEIEEEMNFMSVKNLKTGQIFKFPLVSFNNFVDYRFSQGAFKLLYGNYIWDSEAGESHFGPHFWELSVYQFKKGEFIKDKSWNNGEKYLTDEKISVTDEGYQRIREIFVSQ